MPATDSPKATIISSSLPLIAAVCGVALIGLSLAWPSFSNGRSQWTQEQAREYQSVSVEFHGLSHAHEEDASEGDHAARLQAAEAKFNKLRSELEAARRAPRDTAFMLLLAGITLTALGAVAHLWVHRRST